MKHFICEFNGVWLGGYAVVLAESIEDAREKLLASLPEHLGRKNPSPDYVQIKPMDISSSNVLVIWDGDY